MENKEFFSLFPEFRFEEKIEKPLELYSHANSLYYWFRVGEGTFGIHHLISNFAPTRTAYYSLCHRQVSLGKKENLFTVLLVSTPLAETSPSMPPSSNLCLP
jgi:hypothetical protein